MPKRSVPDAARRARVLTIAEWRAAGLSSAQVRALVRSGDLVRAWPGVYATRPAIAWAQASPARAHALRVMAARAAVGRDSAASHQSAAIIHGLDLYPAPPANRVVLTRPPSRRSGRSPGDRVFFHTAELPEDQVHRKLGVRVTSVPRTVVDLARPLPRSRQRS